MRQVYLLLLTIIVSTTIFAQKKKEKESNNKFPIDKQKTFKTKSGLRVFIIQTSDTLEDLTILVKSNTKPILEDSIVGVGYIAANVLKRTLTQSLKDNGKKDIEMSFDKREFTVKAHHSEISDLSRMITDLMNNNDFKMRFFVDEQNKMYKAISSYRDSLPLLFGDISRSLLYTKKHPFGEIPTQETINKITSNDADQYLKKVYHPKNCQVFIVSSQDASEVQDYVFNLFDSWKEKESSIPKQKYPEPLDIKGTNINFIHDTDLHQQSYISTENLIKLNINSVGYFPAIVALELLKLGLVGSGEYDAEMSEEYEITNSKYVGSFSGVALASAKDATNAFKSILDNLDIMVEQPVDGRSIKEAKDSIVSQFKRDIWDKEYIANAVYNIKNIPLLPDYYDTYIEKVMGVSAKNVQLAAKTYFKSNNNRMVVLGNGRYIAHQLKELVKEEWATEILYFDYKADTIPEPPYRSPIPEGVTLDSIMNNYLNRIGSKKKIGEVYSQYLIYEANMNGVDTETVIKRNIDDMFSLDIKVRGNTLNKQVINKDNGYMIVQPYKGGYMGADPIRTALNKEDVQVVRQSMELFPENRISTRDVVLECLETLDQKDYYVVSYDDMKDSYYDVTTGLKYRDVIHEKIGSETILSIIYYKDYKPLQGILFPYTMHQEFGGKGFDFKIKELDINNKVKDEDFIIPQDIIEANKKKKQQD